MEQPPKDEHGNVQPHDHCEILDDDEVIRRISEQQVVVDNGQRRISSKAFKPSSKKAGLSIDLKRLIEVDGIDPKEYVTTPHWVGSLLFKAKDFREENLQVGYEPVVGHESVPDNPYHGEVWGNFSNSVQENLRRKAEWFVRLEGVNINK